MKRKQIKAVQTEIFSTKVDHSLKLPKKIPVPDNPLTDPVNHLPDKLANAFRRSKNAGIFKALGLGSYDAVKLSENLCVQDGDSIMSHISEKYGDDVWAICDDLLNKTLKELSI